MNLGRVCEAMVIYKIGINNNKNHTNIMTKMVPIMVK